jgi:hypothetical protein
VARCSGQSITAVLAFEGGMESDDDVGWRDAFFGEGFGYDGFCSVVLDPDFAVFDVDVKDEVEDSFLVFPADVGELVMVMFGVADDFCFYVVGVTVGMGFVGDDLSNYLLVLLELIHCLTSVDSKIKFHLKTRI